MSDEQNAYWNKFQRYAYYGYRADGDILTVSQYGVNRDVDTATTPEDIWTVGGVYAFPSAPATTTIVSSSAEDTLTTGTGAWYVYIEGLIADYVSASEVVEMNGTNAVTCANDYLRINRIYIGQCGSTGSNVGAIQVKHGAVVLSEIVATEGISKQVIYTVPAGYAGYLISGDFRLLDHQTTTYAFGTLQFRSNLPVITGWIKAIDGIATRDNPYHLDVLPETALIVGGMDIKGTVTTISSDNTTVSGRVDLVLFRT